MVERSSGCGWLTTIFFRNFVNSLLAKAEATRCHPAEDFRRIFRHGAGGKQASYNVTVNEIKEKVLPSFDDAFAAKFFPAKSWMICGT